MLEVLDRIAVESREVPEVKVIRNEPELSIVGEESPSKEVSRVLGYGSDKTRQKKAGTHAGGQGGAYRPTKSPMKEEFRGEREGLKPT